MGFSKGGETSSTPVMPEKQDNSGTEAMLGSFMQAMSGMMVGQQQATQQALSDQQMQLSMSNMPAITEAQSIDWTEKNKELKNKMAAVYGTEAAKKMNTTSTILTSPLLDSEEINTTQSILGAG
jgi:hypothetical protein